MSDVIPYAVAVRNAAEVLLRALVVRDFLPARIAAQRAHVSGGHTVEELEALIVERREVSIAARMCMARGDHGFFDADPVRTSVANGIDRASEQIIRERAQDNASRSAVPSRRARSVPNRGPRKKVDPVDEPLPELAFMTIREVARMAWGEDLGVATPAEAEELIRTEHAARMASYRSRCPQACPLTQGECRPVARDETPPEW
ncbi:hypothetical protein [Streptomyces sp. Ru73]|uniref:hypothetical protein n=1 Tax=Streptomyces sp. Ru73 TaxID=2080748 RepID=UPI0011B01083|nr:hypothetical protein [Streptomyces sp. Ru73]